MWVLVGNVFISQLILISMTKIMGILNVTPDSFSDGGKFFDTSKAVEHALQMEKDGADFIDVGGESTKPGSEPVSEEEELRRVIPVIEAIKDKVKVPISIDSYKATVVDKAIIAGATWANDVSGLRDEEMMKVVAKHNVPVVCMHMQGDPKTMQDKPHYEDVVTDIISDFKKVKEKAESFGVKEILFDPGIGFGKTVEHNLTILKRLEEFKVLGKIVIGPSRKSFIGKLTGAEVDGRLGGTLGAVVISMLNGVDIIRVHDVKEAKQAVEIVKAIRNA